MSWVSIPENSDFSLINLPFGVFSVGGGQPRCGVALGEYVIDLQRLHTAGLLNSLPFDTSIFGESTLNSFMALDRPAWRSVRTLLTDMLSADGSNSSLRDNEALQKEVFIKQSDVKMHLSAKVGDYTDFYSSREHATNVGIMFRGVDNALQPNWLHLPVGYHGRASSVVVSGTDVVRPRGQLQIDKADPSKGSTHGPCKLMDFELETGFYVGGSSNPLGRALTLEEAEDRIFGVVLLNDWSARDIQAWEYVPLGPFTSKSFATSVSPWVVTIDALEAFRCSSSAGTEQTNPEPLPYLKDPNYGNSSYNINLKIAIKPEGSDVPYTISTTNFKYMYWNMKQQLVHHSVSGANMQPGDLLGSGTISGTNEVALGSMLELSWRGAREVKMVDPNTNETIDEVRKFLKDGDEVIMSGFGANDAGQRVGFGSVTGKVLPAGSYDSKPLITHSKSCSSVYHSFKLYSYFRSTASWRVRIALAMKNIEYEYVPVDLMKLVGNNTETIDSDVSNKNGLEQIPILEFSDADGATHTLTQSMAIMEFLEDAFPCNHILPSDVLLKSRVRQCAEIVNSGTAPLQNIAILRQVKQVEVTGTSDIIDGRGFAKHNITRGLSALEKLAKGCASNPGAGVFLGGSVTPTIADICLIPQLYNANRFGIDLEQFPTLMAIQKNCENMEAFKKAHPESQPDFK